MFGPNLFAPKLTVESRPLRDAYGTYYGAVVKEGGRRIYLSAATADTREGAERLARNNYVLILNARKG